MKTPEETDHLLQEYRRRTSGQAPPELRSGVLARLTQPFVTYPLAWSLGAIAFTAILAAVFSFLIATSKANHRHESPPSFLENSPANSWLSLR